MSLYSKLVAVGQYLYANRSHYVGGVFYPSSYLDNLLNALHNAIDDVLRTDIMASITSNGFANYKRPSSDHENLLANIFEFYDEIIDNINTDQNNCINDFVESAKELERLLDANPNKQLKHTIGIYCDIISMDDKDIVVNTIASDDDQSYIHIYSIKLSSIFVSRYSHCQQMWDEIRKYAGNILPTFDILMNEQPVYTEVLDYILKSDSDVLRRFIRITHMKLYPTLPVIV